MEKISYLPATHRVYVPYLDLTLKTLIDAIGAFRWEWSVFTVSPKFLPVRESVIVLIVTENPKIDKWLNDLLSGVGYVRTANDFWFEKGITVQLRTKADARGVIGWITHIIDLIGMGKICNAIHHRTTVNSREELRILLSRVKWRWLLYGYNFFQSHF